MRGSIQTDKKSVEFSRSAEIIGHQIPKPGIPYGKDGDGELAPIRVLLKGIIVGKVVSDGKNNILSGLVTIFSAIHSFDRALFGTATTSTSKPFTFLRT